MSNPFYTYSGSFIPGTIGRAEAIAAEFQSVQTGFSLLPQQGVDTGAANAYIVTTGGQPTVAYANGNTISFKALAANTGGSTINVNGVGVVSLLTYNGSATPAGAVPANVWTTAVYNSTYSGFTLVGPANQTAVIAGSISNAAPTHLVGLTANGGSSIQAAPIDVTFALDQTIAPTWTGTHVFTPSSSVVALTVNAQANKYGLLVQASTTSNQSLGLSVQAGTTSSDTAVSVKNAAGSVTYMQVYGNGSVTIGSPTGGAEGLGTLNATGLFVNGTAVSTAVSANPSVLVGLSAKNGTALTWMTSDSAPSLDVTIVPTWTGKHTFSPGAAGAVTITGGGTAGSGLAAATINDGGSSTTLTLNSTYTGGGYIQIQRGSTTKAFLGDSSQLDGGTLDDLTLRSNAGLGLSSGGGVRRLTISSAGAATFSSTLAINGGTPTAALSGFGSPSGAITSGLTGAATLAQTAGTLGGFLAYMKTIGFVAT